MKVFLDRSIDMALEDDQELVSPRQIIQSAGPLRTRAKIRAAHASSSSPYARPSKMNGLAGDVSIGLETPAKGLQQEAVPPSTMGTIFQRMTRAIVQTFTPWRSSADGIASKDLASVILEKEEQKRSSKRGRDRTPKNNISVAETPLVRKQQQVTRSKAVDEDLSKVGPIPASAPIHSVQLEHGFAAPEPVQIQKRNVSPIRENNERIAAFFREKKGASLTAQEHQYISSLLRRRTRLMAGETVSALPSAVPSRSVTPAMWIRPGSVMGRIDYRSATPSMNLLKQRLNPTRFVAETIERAATPFIEPRKPPVTSIHKLVLAPRTPYSKREKPIKVDTETEPAPSAMVQDAATDLMSPPKKKVRTDAAVQAELTSPPPLSYTKSPIQRASMKEASTQFSFDSSINESAHRLASQDSTLQAADIEMSLGNGTDSIGRSHQRLVMRPKLTRQFGSAISQGRRGFSAKFEDEYNESELKHISALPVTPQAKASLTASKTIAEVFGEPLLTSIPESSKKPVKLFADLGVKPRIEVQQEEKTNTAVSAATFSVNSTANVALPPSFSFVAESKKQEEKSNPSAALPAAPTSGFTFNVTGEPPKSVEEKVPEVKQPAPTFNFPAATPSTMNNATNLFQFGGTAKVEEPKKSEIAVPEKSVETVKQTENPAEVMNTKTPFTFGQPAAQAETVNTSFNFGSTPATTGNEAKSATETPAPSGFAFGQSAPVFSSSTVSDKPPVFNLNAPTSAEKPPLFGKVQEQKSEESKSVAPANVTFNFGAAASSSTPSFTFTKPVDGNSASSASTASTGTPVFGTGATPSFGANKSNAMTAAFDNTSTTATQGAPQSTGFTGFGSSNTSTGAPSFGGNTATVPSFGVNNAASAFGSNPSTSSAPAFGSTATTSVATGPPVFGSSAPAFGSSTTATAPAFGSSTNAAAPAFGSSTTATPAFGSSTAATAPAFGSTTNAKAPVFGAAPSTAITAPAFAAPATTTATPFGATAPALNATPFASAPAPSFGLASNASTPFGSNTTTPAFGQGSVTAFDQPQRAASAPVFGGSATMPSSAPAFAAPATTTPAFGGFQFNTTTAPAAPPTSFTFGQTRPHDDEGESRLAKRKTDSTSSQPTPFSFGSTANNAAPSSFTFQPANTANAPAASVPTAFAFGNNAANNANPSFTFNVGANAVAPPAAAPQQTGFSAGAPPAGRVISRPVSRRKK